MELGYEKLYKVMAHFLSLHEADAVACMLLQNYTAEDIIEYIEWCGKRYEQDEETDVDIWLEETGRE
jgi:hypothetical protein